MRRATTAIALAVLVGLLTLPVAGASSAGEGSGVLTMAVYGDAPYGLTNTDTSQTLATPAFVASVNADPDVSTVVHVGDIHSGKQYCTEAYDRTIAELWTRFEDSLVYTPGDNEWADCHKAAEGGGLYDAATGRITYVLDPATDLPVDFAGGDPLANLALVRSIFFAEPGRTLGGGKLHVQSRRRRAYDRAHPDDAAFVENVDVGASGVLFVARQHPRRLQQRHRPLVRDPDSQ